jgi:hypothetical protein
LQQNGDEDEQRVAESQIAKFPLYQPFFKCPSSHLFPRCGSIVMPPAILILNFHHRKQLLTFVPVKSLRTTFANDLFSKFSWGARFSRDLRWANEVIESSLPRCHTYQLESKDS